MDAYILEIHDPFGPPRRVGFRHLPFRIGRSADNDLSLPDPMVSRHHAHIEKDAGQLCVVDNQSRNGVVLNGECVRRRQALCPGDLIGIGPYDLRLRREASLAALDHDETRLGFYPADSSAHVAKALQPDTGGAMIPGDELVQLLMQGGTQQVYEAALDIIQRFVSFDRCFLILVDDQSLENLEIAASRHAPNRVVSDSSQLYLSREILRRVVQTGEAVTVSLGQGTFDPSRSFLQSGAQSAVCFPLVAEKKTLGVVYLDRLSDPATFSEEVVRDVRPLTSLLALKIENAQLLQAQVEAEIDRRDLETAKAVQERFLPRRGGTVGDYSFEVYSQPCRQVGGDCLDVVHGSKGEVRFAVGDVAGKGLPAALYMVGVLSTLRAYVEKGAGLADVMARMEVYVSETFREDHFLTLVLAELDTHTGTLACCNAGHPPPLMFSSDGTVHEIESHDPALNIVHCQKFQLNEVRLAPSDLVLVYTDGLVEADNEEGEWFGKERLIDCIRSQRMEPLETIRQKTLAALAAFRGQRGPHDDATLLLLRRAAVASQFGQPPAEHVTGAGESPVLSRQIASDLAERDRVISEVLEAVRQQGLQPDAYLHRLCLDEALTNAIIHGNGSDPRKLVSVAVFCSPPMWTVEIADEGAGFDWEAWCRLLENGLPADRESGRGIKLILRSGADVRFLEGGRRIRMSWRSNK